MNNKEINLRSIIFLFIGIILIVSLIICVYIISSERDLISIKGEVTKVIEDSNNKGENDVTVTYKVDGKTYNYNFYYSQDVKEGDKIDIYYHKNEVSSVQTYKTSYFIFVCPSFGLLLCLLGLVETFRKNDEDENDLYETKVIEITDETQQLEVVTGDDLIEYEKLPEETVEPEINSIKKDLSKKVKRKESIKRITPTYYYLSKDAVVYETNNSDKLMEIKVDTIKSIVKEVDRNGHVLKEILVMDDFECNLTPVKNVNLDRFSVFLRNKLLNSRGSFEEEIVNK